MKSILTAVTVACLLLLVYAFWPESTVSYPPGVLAPEAPVQENIAEGKSWKKNEYEITPLAKFRLKARVLHRKTYGSGRESDLSPIDLALGWGRMSDQAVMDKLDFSQSGRWYFWKTKTLPIPQREIESCSSNMHMIPADEETESALSDVRRGDLIELEGYLVKVRAPDGWHWKSSMSRTDSGNGACELVWVETLRILAPDASPP